MEGFYRSIAKVTFLALLTGMMSSCKKDNMRGEMLSIHNSDINIHDIGNNDLTRSVLYKKDILIPGNVYRAGFAYSSLLKLKNGGLLLTAMGHRRTFDDFDSGEIISVHSEDNGESWTEPTTIQENIGQVNVTAPSLLLNRNGKLLFAFLAKDSKTSINVYCKESSNNGLSWSNLSLINTRGDGYNMTTNGRMIMTSGGRIIIPMGFLKNVERDFYNQSVFCFVSDDMGKTWRKTKAYSSRYALMEPSVTELENGVLLMALRNNSGKILFTKSYDNGETWSNITRSAINSPEAPQTIMYSKKDKCLFMVWNNCEYNPSVFHTRDVLTLAISRDQGKTWINKGDLENNPLYNFFYSDLKVFGDTLMISYSKHMKSSSKPGVTLVKLDIPTLLNESTVN